MITASMVAVIVVVAPVWAAAIIDMVEAPGVLIIGVLVDVIVIVLEFDFPVSYSLDVPLDVTADLFMDSLILDVPPGIGIEVLANANTNVFAGVMTALGIPVSTALEELSR